MFRCDDDRKVVEIGPPPVNLRHELENLRIICGGRMIPCRRREFERLCVLGLTCDQTANAEKNLPLRFSFSSFDVEIEVSLPLSVPAEAYLGLVTLQRNNPLPWILDWCRWHHRLHGVSRLVLYDNASDNRDELAAALARMGMFARLRRQRRGRGVVRFVHRTAASGTTSDGESTYQLVLVPQSRTSRPFFKICLQTAAHRIR